LPEFQNLLIILTLYQDLQKHSKPGCYNITECTGTCWCPKTSIHFSKFIHHLLHLLLI